MKQKIEHKKEQRKSIKPSIHEIEPLCDRKKSASAKKNSKLAEKTEKVQHYTRIIRDLEMQANMMINAEING